MGPVDHTFTDGDDTVLAQLERFEATVNALRADSGGEYALDAMLAALAYMNMDSSPP